MISGHALSHGNSFWSIHRICCSTHSFISIVHYTMCAVRLCLFDRLRQGSLHMWNEQGWMWQKHALNFCPFLWTPLNSANLLIYLANSIAAFSIRGQLWKMIEWHAMNRKRNEWLLIAGHLTMRCVTRRESRVKNMRAILDQLRKRRMGNGAWTQWMRSSIRTTKIRVSAMGGTIPVTSNPT